MKKYFLLNSFLFVFILTACSQSIKQSEVPAAAKTTIENQYPGLTYKWEKEDGNYEVNFKKDGKAISVVITETGKILATETEMAVADLPAAALDYMKTHYSGKNIKEAAKIVSAEGYIMYEAAIKEKDIMFDKNGKFLKEEKD